jgi:hypothetical protein
MSNVMPRPQTYTDDDIAAAIQALAAAGEDVNPMRVRMRLGGGNIGRIKAVIANTLREPALSAKAAAPPPDMLAREFERLSAEAAKSVLSIATRCWAAAWAQSAKTVRDENVRQGAQIERLEADVRASSDLIAQMEEQAGERERILDEHLREKADLARTCADLGSTLSTAESDLRATQQVIETFERNQRQDRQDIRDLQKRIEDLVGEIAVLKAAAPRPSRSRRHKGT